MGHPGTVRKLGSDRPVRLVAERLRVPVLLVALLGGTGVALLGARFAGDDRAGRADRLVAGLVPMRSGAARALADGVADRGAPGPIAAAVLVLALLAWSSRGPRGLALVLVGPPLAMVTTSLVLKPLIDRTHEGGLAFPSGHTTSVASVSVAAAVLLLGRVTVPAALRWGGSLALAVLVVSVGTSLVVRDYHYATDTVGGVGVALAVVLLTALAIDLLADARAPGPVEAPTVAVPAAS